MIDVIGSIIIILIGIILLLVMYIYEQKQLIKILKNNYMSALTIIGETDPLLKEYLDSKE